MLKIQEEVSESKEEVRRVEEIRGLGLRRFEANENRFNAVKLELNHKGVNGVTALGSESL